MKPSVIASNYTYRNTYRRHLNSFICADLCGIEIGRIICAAAKSCTSEQGANANVNLRDTA